MVFLYTTEIKKKKTCDDFLSFLFIQDVLDEWLICQRSWLYLEPIFSSEDINRQLPVEGKRYQTMERMWRKLMKNANDNTQVILVIYLSNWKFYIFIFGY